MTRRLVLAATVTGAMLVAALAATTSTAAAHTDSAPAVDAAQAAEAAQAKQKRYRATRPIVADKQTGRWRTPTPEETAALVDNLAALTSRATEGLVESTVASGGTAVDLEGGFAGVMLARPNEDGTVETLCVFTFAEGAEFLGLVEDIQ